MTDQNNNLAHATMTGDEAWNPRYLLYCKANGIDDPEKMLDLDQEKWPGGCMTGYILWIREKLSAFCKVNPNVFFMGRSGSLMDHFAFDVWLKENYKCQNT